MSRILSFILLLLLPFSLLSQQWKTFTDTSISFTAKYPATWTNKIKESKTVFFTSPAENEHDDFLENVNVSMTRNEEFGKKIKLKESIPAVLTDLTNAIDDFTKISERYFKWNNNDACELIYTGEPKGSKLQIKFTQWFCFSEGRLFVATYTALLSNTATNITARKILSSIVFR